MARKPQLQQFINAKRSAVAVLYLYQYLITRIHLPTCAAMQVMAVHCRLYAARINNAHCTVSSSQLMQQTAWLQLLRKKTTAMARQHISVRGMFIAYTFFICCLHKEILYIICHSTYSLCTTTCHRSGLKLLNMLNIIFSLLLVGV